MWLLIVRYSPTTDPVTHYNLVTPPQYSYYLISDSYLVLMSYLSVILSELSRTTQTEETSTFLNLPLLQLPSTSIISTFK